MPRANTVWSLLLLSCSLAAHADSADVPALGLRIASLPDSSSAPVVSQVAGGDQMTVQLDKATLTIFRAGTPEPEGSDVASPSYRASLDARFKEHIDSKDRGAPTALGGHGAWTVVAASSEGEVTRYACVTYVIDDQHLYRMTVDAAGDPRPPEFDGLVKALSGITFEPLHRA